MACVPKFKRNSLLRKENIGKNRTSLIFSLRKIFVEYTIPNFLLCLAWIKHVNIHGHSGRCIHELYHDPSLTKIYMPKKKFTKLFIDSFILYLHYVYILSGHIFILLIQLFCWSHASRACLVVDSDIMIFHHFLSF